VTATPRRLWLPEEDRIVARYAKALASGRYRYKHEAVSACFEELGHLYARLRKTNPKHPVAERGRSLHMVGYRLRFLLRKQGLFWTWFGLSGAEKAATRRYARALVAGRFPDALRAAEACLAEVRALPLRSRPMRPRTLATIHLHILEDAHRLRRTWPRARWLDDEDRILRRYGRALAHGKYADSGEAIRSCCRELARLPRPRAGGYAARSIRTRLLKWAHEAGWVSRQEPWNREAQRVIEGYIRKLYEGEYRTVPAVAEACTRELRRRAVAGRLGRRVRLDVVHRELARRTKRLRLPRHRANWHSGELRILEAYARRVGRGDFLSWRKAAVACHAELQRFWARSARGSSENVRALAGRGIAATHGRMLILAHELGLPGPERRLWTPPEEKVVAGWVRWYDKYRTPTKRGPLGTAASGLWEELEERGFRRTVSSCRERLKDGWLLIHGLTARHTSRISERRRAAHSPRPASG